MPWLLRMTVLVSLLMVPPILYLSWRLFRTSQELFGKYSWIRILFPVILVSFFIYPASGLTDFYLTGDIDLLKYPKPLAYWFWFGLVFVFQLLTWVLIADLLKWGSRFVSNSREATTYWHAVSVFALLAIVFFYTSWKVYSNTTTINEKKVEVAVEDLPAALRGFKIVHISDVQGDEYTGREQIARYVRQINEQEADLIIFTGDLISYGTDFIKMAARELGKAEAKYGTLAVVGDHDYWAGVPEVKRALKAKGIPLLQDENIEIEPDSAASLAITGVTEVYSQQSDPQVVDSLMAATSSAVKVLASHQVAEHLITSAQKHNYQLLLAGHTHGGQIRVPFMGMTFSASDLETQYVSNVYQRGNLMVNINNGLGFTLAPIRFNAYPSVSVIRLKEKEK